MDGRHRTSPRLLELEPDPDACPRDQRPGGGVASPDRGRDLLAAEPVGGQQQRRPGVDREGREDGVDRRRALAREHAGFGRLDVVSLLGPTVAVHPVEGRHAAAPPADREIRSHPIQPPPNVLRRPSGLDLPGQPEKRLLEQILRRALVTSGAAEEAVQLGVIGLECGRDHAVLVELAARGNHVDFDEPGPHRIRHSGGGRMARPDVSRRLVSIDGDGREVPGQPVTGRLPSMAGSAPLWRSSALPLIAVCWTASCVARELGPEHDGEPGVAIGVERRDLALDRAGLVESAIHGPPDEPPVMLQAMPHVFAPYGSLRSVPVAIDEVAAVVLARGGIAERPERVGQVDRAAQLEACSPPSSRRARRVPIDVLAAQPDPREREVDGDGLIVEPARATRTANGPPRRVAVQQPRALLAQV